MFTLQLLPTDYQAITQKVTPTYYKCISLLTKVVKMPKSNFFFEQYIKYIFEHNFSLSRRNDTRRKSEGGASSEDSNDTSHSFWPKHDLGSYLIKVTIA